MCIFYVDNERFDSEIMYIKTRIVQTPTIFVIKVFLVNILD